ncbi:MAG: hypothetical protein E7497_01345 [Ruminococcus sp.]|nr:hypothetical protein [Ruminococcus sp.]
MKKAIIILTALLLLFCTACGEENTSTSEDYIVYSGDSGSCGFKIVENVDELAEYIIDNRNGSSSKAFNHSAQKDNESAFTIYSPANIPSGYNLSEIRIRDYSSYISMDYVCDDSENGKSKITFVWGFETDGDKFLSQAINMMELSPMPGMPGYYYIGVTDDYGVEIYQIYWSEDGYYMQANIPTSLIGNFEENDMAVLSGESEKAEYNDILLLEKTEYPIK